jgi:UDP-N-acetylglucosamine 2-epimerase
MDILEGIRLATSSDFRGRLAGLVNPYGDGRAADRIVAALKSAELGDRLMVKRFQDVAVEVPAGAFAR